ncbi:MAG: hypothetical protein HY735_33540 [Verrucomicrobia bacterium]|nr:hypothetical protein [Verrucomicrobiota bacterium]
MSMKLKYGIFIPTRTLLCAALTALSSFSLHTLPIITNVIETGGDGEATDTITAKWTGVSFSNGIAGEFLTPYTVPRFGEDVPAYVDRLHQWNGATAALPLPNYLAGGEYIMIGNDNKDNYSLVLEITLSEPATVYLLIDNRLTDGSGANPPESSALPSDWTTMNWVATEGYAPVMTGWNRTADPAIPDEVGVDEGGDGVGPGAAINNYSSVFSKTVKAGTLTIYEPGLGTGNMFGIVVKGLPGSVSNPPQIASLNPTNNVIFHDAASGLNFSATTTAPNRIEAANVKLELNGTDVSTGVVLGGTSASRTVSYNSLKPDTIYTARIVVSDQAGRATTNLFSFDTFSASTAVAIDAEDYNYDGGKSLTAPKPAGYANLTGKPEADYHDENTTTAATQYRPGDYVGLAALNDGARPGFASGTDYQVTQMTAGDWLNYTRAFNNNTYNIYLRASGGGSSRLRLDKISGDPSGTSQTPFAVGRFAVPATASATPFTYVPLADVSGNPVAMALSGAATLRLTALPGADASAQLNFLLFVPASAAARPAYVSDVSPASNAVNVGVDAVVKAYLVNGTATVTPGSVTLSLNGNNVTSAATVSPTADGVLVAYDPPGPLAINSTFTANLSFKDAAGASFTHQWTFKTVPFIPNITKVVESGGDDEATDTVTAKWTGVTFSNGVAGEFLTPLTVPRFGEDVPAYVDRLHQWNGATPTIPLPNYLAGGEYIMSGNDNRDNASYQLEVTVAEPARVYVLVDNRLGDSDGASPPDFSTGSMSWLLDNGWTPVTNGLNRTADPTLPDEVGVDEGGDGAGPGVAINQWSSVYGKNVPAGTFSLFQADNAGQNMYGVVITPQFSLPTVTLTSPADDASFPNLPATVTLTADAAVTGGKISKVEFFYAATNKIGEATAAPFRAVWSNPNPGRYTLTAIATDANNRSTVSKPVRIVVGKLISINFQAATATTPAGYWADVGEVFGDRGNGYKYGWDDDNTQHARERNSVNSPDKRYDTLNHMQKTSPLPAGRVWEIEVPNGRYSVFAVSGDPDNQDSVYDLQAEGVTIVRGTPTATIRFFEGTGIVTVNDGRLSLSNGPTASNNKIAFVDVAALPAEAPKPVFGKPVLNGTTLTITWTGGGKLQEASDVTGPWRDVAGSPSGTFTTQTVEPRKFYRLVVP